MKRRMCFNLFRALLVLAASIGATGSRAAAEDLGSPIAVAHEYRVNHEKEVLNEFSQLLSIPNVATVLSDIQRNAEFITLALNRRGFQTRLLSAGAGTPPSVYGELAVKGAERTILFYAHYDGQPIEQTGWRSRPFSPVVRQSEATTAPEIDWRAASKIDGDWRIYARSASDDKAPIQAMLAALDALRAAGLSPAVNVKVFYEGEEEQGSPHLQQILDANKQLLKADAFILTDGPRPSSSDMQLFFGARGILDVELTVFGPLKALHDGHYGNWAPNPAIMLTHLLASLRDDDARVLIPGFYRHVRPTTRRERAASAALGGAESELKRELGLGRTEGSHRLADAIFRPALNLRGIRVGDVGDAASNTIFPEARASIDFRLVPDQTPQNIRSIFETFLTARGWFIVHSDPDLMMRRTHQRIVRLDWGLGYPGYRADLDSPEARRVREAVSRATRSKVLDVPMLGGSSPMSVFAKTLGLPIIGLPVANYDNNQHAANENLRLQNLWDAIEIFAAVLTQQ